MKPYARRDWNATLIRIGIMTLVLAGSAVLLSALDVSGRWIIWLVVSVFSIGWLIRWHTRTFGYECSQCSYAFEISPWRNMVSPNSVGRGGPRKYLRCPNCGRRAWTPVRVLIEHP